ncbi:MAG: hypothetical protein ACJ8FT_11735 [Sphingomonas sp.]
MRIISKLLAATAALAAAGPAAAQYYSNPYSGYGYAQSYGYSQPYAQSYGYSQQYARPYGYAQTYAVNTNVAAQQCSAAVQNRLYNRSSIGGILGAVLGTSTTGRVVSVTQVSPRSNGTVRVRGLASSGRYASNGYGAYGVGAYGALGYGSQADLSFRCEVGMNGQVYNVSINRRY